MKLIEVKADSFLFEFAPREKALLIDLLGRYPLVPGVYQKVSKTGRSEETARTSQTLLDEALSEQRKENRGKLRAFLDGGLKFNAVGAGYRFTIRRTDIDWLLEVLNDIRVGSWVILGSPSNEEGGPPTVNEENIPYLWTMEASGFFQMALLHALGVE